MMPTLSSVAAPAVVVKTTASATSDDKVGIEPFIATCEFNTYTQTHQLSSNFSVAAMTVSYFVDLFTWMLQNRFWLLLLLVMSFLLPLFPLSHTTIQWTQFRGVPNQMTSFEVQITEGIDLNITLTSKWPRWRLKSPAAWLFTQSFIQAQIKENIKAPRHWLLCGEFSGTGEFPAQRASIAENVSIWWRHHE